MPFNAAALSFMPLSALAAPNNPAAVPPTILEPDGNAGNSTAQLTTMGLSSITVTTAGVTVLTASPRNTVSLVVPTDQLAVTVSNNNSYYGAQGALPSTWPLCNPLQGGLITPPANGYNIQPGNSIQLAPYNDPVYAIVASGTSLLFYRTS